MIKFNIFFLLLLVNQWQSKQINFGLMKDFGKSIIYFLTSCVALLHIFLIVISQQSGFFFFFFSFFYDYKDLKNNNNKKNMFIDYFILEWKEARENCVCQLFKLRCHEHYEKLCHIGVLRVFVCLVVANFGFSTLGCSIK